MTASSSWEYLYHQDSWVEWLRSEPEESLRDMEDWILSLAGLPHGRKMLSGTWVLIVLATGFIACLSYHVFRNS